MKRLGALAAVFSACLFLKGQSPDRDFLSANEVDQVRLVQEPNERLQLYLHFASQRLDIVGQYLAKEKPGRSIFIHNALEDFGQIIEAIDSVSDDALLRHADISKGMGLVAEAEKGFLEKLNKIHESGPKDLDRYQFVLSNAIDTTNDSRELSLQDLSKRSGELKAEDAKEKAARDAMSSDKDKKKTAEAPKDGEEKKKVPSLYKPGEKPANSQ